MKVYLTLVIIVLGYLFYNKIQEGYLNIDYCPKCLDLWEGKCNSCNNCGWCIDRNYNGECMPGDKNGPYKNKFCRQWYYDGICRDGPECDNIVQQRHYVPRWWVLPNSWWFGRKYYGGNIQRPMRRPLRRSFRRPFRRPFRYFN